MALIHAYHFANDECIFDMEDCFITIYGVPSETNMDLLQNESTWRLLFKDKFPELDVNRDDSITIENFCRLKLPSEILKRGSYHLKIEVSVERSTGFKRGWSLEGFCVTPEPSCVPNLTINSSI